MAQSEARLVVATTTNVFEQGNLPIKCFQVDKSDQSSPPKELYLVTPTVPAKYPVLVFLHGFFLRNYFYSALLQHISSHGFIVVAPQLYLVKCNCNGMEEVVSVAEVTDWLTEGLQSTLPEGVEADLQKVGLAGHSRGGKIAFAVALRYGNTSTKLEFSKLIGIDPVAEANRWLHTEPKILTNVAGSWDLSMPATVIGTGLGGERKCALSVPCAPEGVSHEEFYKECKGCAFHFVAEQYGHMDMLDDDPPGVIGKISGCTCKNGDAPRDPMRRFVAGIIVAFLSDSWDDQNGPFFTVLHHPDCAPVKLQLPEFK